MANIRETRNLHSNAPTFNLAPMASSPEHILRDTSDPSFYTTFTNPQQAEQEPAVALEAALASYDHGPSSNPTQIKIPALDLPLSLTGILDYPELCKSFLNIAQVKARHMYVFELDKSLKETTGDALPYAYMAGYEAAFDGLRKASFYFVERILTEMSHRCTLDDMSEFSI